MKIRVKKILEDMPKDLTDIEKVRYIYLSVGDIFSYDRDYMYLGREREILAEYSKEMSIDDIEKREYYNKILAVCSQMSLIESETINRLKKANINARIVGYDEEREGHVAVITDIDGKNYYLDIALDLYRIQKDLHQCEIVCASQYNLSQVIKNHLTNCRKEIIKDLINDISQNDIIKNINKDEQIEAFVNNEISNRSIKAEIKFMNDDKYLLKYFDLKYLINKEIVIGK